LDERRVGGEGREMKSKKKADQTCMNNMSDLATR
jgi:hypothetical protein